MKKRCTLFFLAFFVFSLANAQTIIWGGPGDANSEFEGGLNDWTTIGVTATPQDSAANAVWKWDAEGDAFEGAYWGARGPIQSPSVSNGAAVFNSDFLDNGGNVDANGAPLKLGVAPTPHRGELISPVINCTGFDGVVLKFNQYYRNFTTDAIIEVTNGTDSMTYIVNEDVATNAETDPSDQEVLDISEIAANQANVRVKFIFNGDYYFWIIDDVQLVELPQTNLAISDIFYTPSSLVQPISQITSDTFVFSAEISNLGTNTQFDVVFKAEIFDEADVLYFVDSLIIDSIPAGLNGGNFFLDDSLGTVFTLDTLFAPDQLGENRYFIDYSVYAMNTTDFDESNNLRSVQFFVDPSVFSKEVRTTTAFRPGGGGDYQAGNLYRTNPNTQEQYQATIATIRSITDDEIDGPLTGKQVAINLIEVVESEVAPDWSNFDNTQNAGPSNPQLNIVGTAAYEFVDGDDAQNVSIDLLDFDNLENGVPLKPGNRYLIMASYEGANNVIFQGFNDEDIKYLNVISTVVFSGDQWFLGGFGEDVAATARMEISLVSAVDNTPLPEASMKLYPNPTTDYVNMELDLEESGHVTVTIADLTGRVLRIDELDNVQRDTRQYYTGNYANGTYLIRIATEKGTKTKRFIVQK